MKAKKILVFQEYQSLNVLIEAILSEEGYENVYTIENSNYVIAAYHDIQPDVFFCEIDLDYQLEMFIDLILSEDREEVLSKLVCIISNGNIEMEKATQRLGVENFLKKPGFVIKDIMDMVNNRSK
ncbi:hypothetical protein [Halalkalibacter flavus]|jgi:DNA-binding NtrC family response regulator|uniref:hypothetical protein n=1 Tax=Halalkalibacter flavus TaxID=3090668 RepID=UPI002FCACF68